jgi:hypothetical protein
MARHSFCSYWGNGFVWVGDLCSRMIQMYESQSFEKRQLGVTHNLKYMALFHNVAKLIGKKAPSIRIEGSVFYMLLGLTSVFDILRIPFPVGKDLIVSTSTTCVYIASQVDG